MKKTILLLLSQKDNSLYSFLEDNINKTWLSTKTEGCDIWYYYGNSEKFEVKDNVIMCPFGESYANIGHKTLCAFEHLLQFDFDFIFRPNSSSFVNKERLVELSQTFPTKNFYAGTPIHFLGGGIKEEDTINAPTKCAHGCGFILSRDLVELIVNNKDKWKHYMVDDMALCRFMKDFNIELTELDKIFLNIDDSGNLNLDGQILSDEEIKKYHHIRTQSTNFDRKKNVEIMKKCFDICKN
jgi:hypothetical protein